MPTIIVHILQYFEYQELPAPLYETGELFHEVALFLNQYLPDGPEKSTCLRKLLESKDCAFRAATDKWGRL